VKTTREEWETEGRERQSPFNSVERRVKERRAFSPSGRRARERRSSTGPTKRVQSAIGNLGADPSLSAFVESQIVLGRSTQDIVQEIAVRFGVKVSSAAVTAYRNNLAWTGTRAVEQTFEGSREDIDRLIDKMETEGTGNREQGTGRKQRLFLPRSLSSIWQRVRRWFGERRE